MRKTSQKDSVESLHKKALEFQKNGEQDKALVQLDMALDIEPDNPELLYDKAVSLQMLLRFDDAIGYYDKSLEKDKKNFGALVNKGLCLSNPETNRHQEALECFEIALEIMPEDLGALSLRGYSLDSLGRHREAIECFDKILLVQPKEVNILINKGLALSHLGKYDEAIAYFDSVLDIESDNFFAIQLRQEAQKSMKRDFFQ
ncbi:MAG: tetratricopeptide repeat protein [Thaumarchaeota archaeon]|nr:tetratricopeptide repeat protein [Nitrososphaerota archaeon]